VIELKSGTRIWIAAGFTDLRRGFQGLSSIVETVLEQAPGASACILHCIEAVPLLSSLLDALGQSKIRQQAYPNIDERRHEKPRLLLRTA
jgi:hypothetical protein